MTTSPLARARTSSPHILYIAATALNFYLIWRVMTYVVGRHFTIGAQFQRLYKLPHLIARRLADPTGVGEFFFIYGFVVCDEDMYTTVPRRSAIYISI